MNEFESYLLDKINDFRNRIEENKSRGEDKTISFMLNNVTEQLMEVLAEYTLNHKTF